MEALSLKANKRTTLGKKTRVLRRQGITPAHLFGHGLESLSLEVETATLQKIIASAGRTRLIALGIKGDKEQRNVFVKEVQKDVLTGELLHVDLYQVNKNEKVRVEVPLVLVGDSPAMKGKGGTLTNPLTRLSIECLPDLLPPQINVDLGLILAIGQAIYVKDLVVGPDVIVHNDPGQLVARVAEIYVEKVEVAAAPTEAEGETAATAEEGAEKKPEEQAQA
jgi:large subunit ribosomal protein L25